MQNRRLNQKGVTLVEVMISLVILLVVFMGLIQASLVSINSNLRNAVRDGATSIVAEYMSRAKATPIDTLAGAVMCAAAPPFNTTQVVLRRQVRNAIQQYAVETDACFIDAGLNSAQVTVLVTYTYPGEDPANPLNQKTTRINSIVRRP